MTRDRDEMLMIGVRAGGREPLLKRWALGGGATLAIGLLTAGLTCYYRVEDQVVKKSETQVQTDQRQDDWIKNHEAVTGPLVQMLKRHDLELDYIGDAVEWQTFVLSVMAERAGVNLEKYPKAPTKPMRRKVPVQRDPGPGLYAAEIPETHGCP